MVGGEHEDPLTPTAGPQAVGEIQQPRERYGIPAVLAGIGAATAVSYIGGSRVVAAPRGRPTTNLAVPLPVGQMDGAVDVLDDNDGFGAGLHEQLPELGVGVDLGELEVVNVVAEIVGHCGNHAGLAGTGGPVEEIAPLPGAARLLVEGLAAGEFSEVVQDVGFHGGVHGQRVEGAGVLERDRLPGVAPGVQRPAT